MYIQKCTKDERVDWRMSLCSMNEVTMPHSRTLLQATHIHTTYILSNRKTNRHSACDAPLKTSVITSYITAKG